MTSLTLTVTPPRIEQRVRTLGVGTSTPRVSWSVDGASPGWAQTSYEVECIAASVLIEVVPGSPHWPDVHSNTVDPGWVPTRMGAGATDDLELGHDTQVWLATSDEPAADTIGAYWYHRKTQPSAPMVQDHDFQDSFVETLGRITGESMIR